MWSYICHCHCTYFVFPLQVLPFALGLHRGDFPRQVHLLHDFSDRRNMRAHVYQVIPFMAPTAGCTGLGPQGRQFTVPCASILVNLILLLYLQPTAAECFTPVNRCSLSRRSQMRSAVCSLVPVMQHDIGLHSPPSCTSVLAFLRLPSVQHIQLCGTYTLQCQAKCFIAGQGQH